MSGKESGGLPDWIPDSKDDAKIIKKVKKQKETKTILRRRKKVVTEAKSHVKKREIIKKVKNRINTRKKNEDLKLDSVPQTKELIDIKEKL